MALLPLGVVGIPAFDGASWPAKLDAFQVCSGNALCLCLRLGIDLELCSEREHSEDDISDDAAKQVLIASAEVRDNTYSNLLSLLTLCPTHQASLKERGLTRDEIDWLGYRTTPTTRLRRIVTELLERGCVLDGVPGFYCQKDTGQWTLDIRGSGIMLPDRNLNGQIEAIQVRLDKVYNQKFYNLTSIDQYYGTQSKCCPHYVGVHEGDEVVCLTEGVMKADIAYSFALGTSYESGFVGLTGVPSYSQFERALEELNSIGVVRINIMVDSDYQVKEEVRKARDRYIEMGVAAGFEVAPITWTQKRKGVDDLYKHLFRNK